MFIYIHILSYLLTHLLSLANDKAKGIKIDKQNLFFPSTKSIILVIEH